jgi:hypothetical protein
MKFEKPSRIQVCPDNQNIGRAPQVHLTSWRKSGIGKKRGTQLGFVNALAAKEYKGGS